MGDGRRKMDGDGDVSAVREGGLMVSVWKVVVAVSNWWVTQSERRHKGKR
jgi:hypothetical protein